MKLLTICLILLTTCLTLLSGCASTPTADPTVQELYARGETSFTKSRYQEAIGYWKQVKEQFPEPELMAKAEIGIANAYFLDHEYIEAGAAYEDFRRLHPGHDLAQFALYRQALSSYNLITGIDTDQIPVKNALALFEAFVKQHPTSEYVPKVREKIAECRAKLAQYEIYVGRFYYRTDPYHAAIGRLEDALTQFPDYTGHDETLYYLAKACLEANLKDKAQTALSRLIREYPKSSYLADARKLLADKL
jgi:outer membrane protein assembly factor BamD